MESIPANPLLKFNPTTLEDIRKCWNLDNGRMEQSLDILEEWMSKQKHFTNKSFSREYLERTLVSCKGSVEKAKSQIDKLCTMKSLVPKFFISGDVKKNLGDLAEIIWTFPMPKLTKDHCRVFIVKVNPMDLTGFNIIHFGQLSIVICEYLKAHDYANGFIVIHDLRDVNLLEIMSKINVVELQQFMTILVEGFGARLRVIHMLTQSKMIDLFIKTIKSMLSAKIRDRIHVQHDLEELHSVVDKELLPVEYEGEQRSMEELRKDMFDLISSNEHEKYLAEMKASKTDETLRTPDKFNEQIMGLPGSFRTLTVD